MNEMRDTDKLIIQEQGYESGGSSNGTATTCTLRESPNTTEWGERKSSNIQYVVLREGTGTEEGWDKFQVCLVVSCSLFKEQK